MTQRSLFFLIIAVFSALLLQGCAGSVVPLSYPTLPAAPSTVAPKNARTICVVDFENKRNTLAIGQRLNGEKLWGRTTVERWVATSIAEELRHTGHHVLLAETLEDALTLAPDYIIGGVIEEAWLAEATITRYTATVRAHVSLFDKSGSLLTKNSYSSIFSKNKLPIYGVPQTLLDEALFEMLQPAVKLLTTTMR